MKLVNFFKAALAAIGVIAAVSCTDLTSIEERLDTLESDVQALQGQLAAVNTNFETLESLKGAIVISKVEEIQNGYKLTLSNGEVLNLTLVVEEPKEEKPEILGAIEVKETEVKITLADGTVVSVPVVENFKFAITLDGAVVTDVQEFKAGDVVEYAVEQSNVASAAIVACPAGFSVKLEETKLVVTATEAPATKATASSENEIAVLAVSKQGHSVLSKIQVSVNTEGGENEGGENEGGENEGGENEGGETPVAPQNDYEKYMAGEDITVGDLTINKTTYGDATLISNDSADKNIAANGVYFVASTATDVTINGTASQLVVLSADENIATIKRTENKSFYVNASAGNDYFVLSNIKYETVMTSGNVFGIGGDGEVESIYFHKSKIEVPAGMNLLYGAKNIHNINMTDCDVKLHTGTDVKNLFQTNTTSTYESVVFKNNIIYCTDGTITNFALFSNNNATISKLEFRNNTIAQVYCKATGGYISAADVKAADVVSNLFYVPDYSSLIPDKYVGIIWMPSAIDDSYLADTIKSNLAFYNDEAVPSYRIKGTYYKGTGTIYNKAKADNPVPSPDYANGVFTQGENYKSFGAKR